MKDKNQTIVNKRIDRRHHTIPNQRNKRPKDKHYAHSHNADYGGTHTYLSFIIQNQKQGIDILLLMCYDTS